MLSHICNYCNNKFNTRSALNNHIKNAKYCLIIQGKIIKQKEFKCPFCLKNLSSKQKLNEHENICNKKSYISLENQIDILNNKLREQEEKYKEQLREQEEKYKEQLREQKENCKELQKTIERLSLRAIDKPTTTNNTTNNILNITSSIDFKNVNDIKKIIDDDYNEIYAMNGQKGAARFLVDKFLTDENGNLKYVCTDPSRHIFKFKNNKGEIKKDVEAKKLTNYIIDGGIRNKINEVLKDNDTNFDMISNPKVEIHNIKNDNNSFKKELASITS